MTEFTQDTRERLMKHVKWIKSDYSPHHQHCITGRDITAALGHITRLEASVVELMKTNETFRTTIQQQAADPGQNRL